MKNFINHIAFFSCALFFSACQETIQLDLSEIEPQIVIEGLITNSDLNFIKVTKSRSFYESGQAEGVENATVTVSFNSVEYVFEHNPENDAALKGVYAPPAGFTPTVGFVYELSVIVDGREYGSQEEMMPVTLIDSLTVEVNLDELEDPEEEGRVFEVFFFAQEPQDRIDHYLFKFYRNDTLYKDAEEDIYFAEDELLGEEIDNLPIAGFYAIDDTVKVEMYSITRDAFVYYSDVFNLINSDGGMFSPPPANPRNNLSNGALGYFQVSAMDAMEIVVKDPED